MSNNHRVSKNNGDEQSGTVIKDDERERNKRELQKSSIHEYSITYCFSRGPRERMTLDICVQRKNYTNEIKLTCAQ